MGRWLVCSPSTDRMNGWLDGLEDGWIVGKIDDRMGRLMDGWMDRWTD